MTTDASALTQQASQIAPPPATLTSNSRCAASEQGALAGRAEDDLFESLSSHYPMGLRRLTDGSIAALQPLLYTTALVLGVERFGYANRFCFKTKSQAIKAFNALESQDDVPLGFIARR